MNYLIYIQDIREVMLTLFVTGLALIVWTFIVLCVYIVFSKPKGRG